jgi:hypothetical protein
MAWPASIPTIGSGGFATSAQFNDFRDALKAIGDPWPAYTPTLTASTTNPTLGTSSVVGFYRKLGKTVDIDVAITIGSGFVAGSGGYQISFPSGIAPLISNASAALGIGTVRDASPSATTAYTAYLFSASRFSLINAGGVVASAYPITWAAGDIISATIRGMQIA